MPPLSTPARTLLTKHLGSGNFTAAVDVKTKDHLPEGTFEKDPEEIAKTVRGKSDSVDQAVEKLTLAKNRFGHNSTPDMHERLTTALHFLQKSSADEQDKSCEKHRTETRDAGDA